MADDSAEAAEGEEEAPKGGNKKLILFIALPVLIIVLGGAAAFLLLGGSKDAEAANEETVAEGEAGEGGEKGADGEYAKDGEKKGEGEGEYGYAPSAEITFYQLPDILVNIQSSDRSPRYLKLSLTLELNSAEHVALIEPAMPRVMDRFQAFLRELRVEDLSGSSGSYRLRLELLRRVNIAVAPTEVRAVLIEEMLVQ